MAQVLTITGLGEIETTIRDLTRIKKQLPEMTKDAIREWGTILEKDMKVSVGKSYILSDTKLGIEWKQGNRSDLGELFISQHGIYLDSMKPHWVSVRRSRGTLLNWAKNALQPNIRKQANAVERGTLDKFGVYVKPHPFIRNGWRVARPKLNPILKRKISQALAIS